MAVHNKVDEVIASRVQVPVCFGKDEDFSFPHGQYQASMEDTGTVKESCNDAHQENRTGDECSTVRLDETVILSGGQEDCRKAKAEEDDYPQQEPSSPEENPCLSLDKQGDFCSFYDTHSKITTENFDYDSMEASSPALSSLSVNEDDLETWGPPECNQNWTEVATNQLQEPETPVSDEDTDLRSLNYSVVKRDWERRESGTSEIHMAKLPIYEDSEDRAIKGMHRDGGWKIATDIQQGENLLQRLQQVQLRQDVCTPETTHNSQEIQEMRDEDKGVLEMDEEDVKARKRNATGVNEKEDSSLHNVDDNNENNDDYEDDDDNGRRRVSLMGREKIENDGNKDVDTKGRTSSWTEPVESDQCVTGTKEVGDSDDDQISSWAAANLSPVIHEKPSSQTPFTSIQHRLSAAETTIERQMFEAAQEKQNLQRAGGFYNLAENPDILEIPFKINISLEPPAATNAEPSERSDWQFSEQKMQKEISQEIQRELVLVNLGKIPGVYSKGEVRQLKETKLLFEAFQQDNTEGPTRHRKSPTLLTKGQVYPSVLERTHSLEMFSLKSRPIFRAHSLRLHKSTSEMEKSLESFRIKRPTVSSRGKTCLLHTPKPDKNLCLNRSMDSICSKTSAVEGGKKTWEVNPSLESPILKQNPFYKLRPALALQPEVEKDIREAKEREEELRRQRCTLYGEKRRNSEDIEKPLFTPNFKPDVRWQSTGKLERVWPPPTKTSEKTQEPKVQRAGGQKTSLWQRWESGLVNGQTSTKKN
ncbi:uncharacterized protein [Antennarius striatus]|uniref:uncharacterized protein n=1 Tax=Antennarius striatus TaxID=241820 RepID=UPI0035B4498F